MIKTRFVAGIVLLLMSGYTLAIHAQQYTGLTGLIHTPTAEMNREGDARIGIHFINKHSTPEILRYNGEKYHTFSNYLSITPFSWIEVGYTCTFLRMKNAKGDIGGYNGKDRYFSVKLQPLKEGKWWPAIAIGTNDPYGRKNESDVSEKSDGKSQYFCNYYVAATKHFDLKGNCFGIHAAYRKFKRGYNSNWNGIVGGVTFRPWFARNLRAIAEYTGNDVNIGADCLLWKHLLLQASLQNGKFFSGGICLQLNLF